MRVMNAKRLTVFFRDLAPYEASCANARALSPIWRAIQIVYVVLLFA